MSMSKKDFIALADTIRGQRHNFTDESISVLSCFCREQNNRFMAGRWMDYINGKCGKNGGKVRVEVTRVTEYTK